MTDNDQFAFGMDAVAGCKCPVVAAGHATEGRFGHVAAQYDTYVKIAIYEAFRTDDDPTVEEMYDRHGSIGRALRVEYGVSDGIIPADVAREQFERAAEAQDSPDVYEHIAGHLGWN